MTLHERAAEATVIRMLAAGGGETETLSAAVRSVADGIVSPETVDVMGRPFRSGARLESWPLAQLWCIGYAHASINGGAIGRIEITVPGGPGGPERDREREANQAMLASLPHPFTAEVDLHQHGADCDGNLSWSEPVFIAQATPPPGYREKATPKYVCRDVVVRPGTVPLEVGSTTPSRTLMHLIESGGVARWPYGSATVHLWLADLGNWAAPQLAARAAVSLGSKPRGPYRPAPAAWKLRVAVGDRI
jgi:hypothetical protein